MAAKKQIVIPGTNTDRKPDLDALVAVVDELTDQWKRVGAEMSAKREQLLEAMQAAALVEYRCLEVDPPVTVKVKAGALKIALKRDKAGEDEEIVLGDGAGLQ